MKILITGICGFVGHCIAKQMISEYENLKVFGLDNFSRKGSYLNRSELELSGVELIYADIRNSQDIENIPSVDYIIDAAANPSVLAGVDNLSGSRILVDNNLFGTINLLEKCKRDNAGFILLSTSRVYSIHQLCQIPVEVIDQSYSIPLRTPTLQSVDGASHLGINEKFSTQSPISLYGSTKLCSETMALEYGETFNFPVWINRCGVLAGAGQFGKADQGIFSYWIHSHSQKKALKFIGFDGSGYQTRDCFHPQDLVELLYLQIQYNGNDKERIINLGGGIKNAMSLKQLTDWCDDRFQPHTIEKDLNPRLFDIPYFVMDTSKAQKIWNWSVKTPIEEILNEISLHAENNPYWLELCN